MVWERNKTGSNIPASVKRTVRDRQHGMCATYNPTVCTGAIDEYDHTINVKATGRPRRELERDPDLLQGLCTPCHRAKVQVEAAAGRLRRSGRRTPRPHPSDALRAPDA